MTVFAMASMDFRPSGVLGASRDKMEDVLELERVSTAPEQSRGSVCWSAQWAEDL